MNIKHFELYFLSVIKGTRKGVFPKVLCLFLWLLSVPYRILVAFRNWLFDHGWLRSYIPPVPLVISIGNITVGGTGKTPVTLMIAQELTPLAPLAILSRGYRSQAENFSVPLLLHKKKGFLHPASLCGDEPCLLADNLPEAMVIVGKDRYQSSKVAARMGARALILDDGMQHRGIARDIEVVVIDQLDPFGHGYFLPRGLLREGHHSLRRADLIIINHAQDKELSDEIKRKISRYTSAPLIRTCLEVVGTYDLNNRPIELREGANAALFCGIAHPEYFRKTVEQLKVNVLDQFTFPDHDAMNLDQLILFSKECVKKNGELLLCTEKDRVKLTETAGLALPLGWVKTHLKIIEGQEHWKALIDRAKMHLGNNTTYQK